MSLLFIPLDDRPATRDAVLDLAAVAGIPVRTPEPSLLGTRDRGADVHAVWSWIQRQVEGPEAPAACIASIEMLCFGGLVASRRSTRHWRNILPWLDRVYSLAARVPTYVSAVIPRTPVSGGTDEDSAYWETHGDALRAYSTAADEFAWMGSTTAAQQVADALGHLPAGIVEAVLQHRRRHLLLNAELLIAAGRGSIRALLIGQDDTTAAGLSRLDREGLERLARVLGAENARLTTGADELGAVMFARWLNESRSMSPAVRIVYTFPQARDRVPAYESQPLAETVREHVEAAGCRVVTEGEDVFLWVHNFEDERQGEALHQEKDGLTVEARGTVIRVLREAAQGEYVAAVADVRYANGADRAFVDLLLRTHEAGGIGGYAGWNTASNSVGSAVAQAVVAHHMRRAPTDGGREALRHLMIARLLDDWGYQAVVRPQLAAVLRERGGDPASLDDHEPLVQKQAEELLRGILPTLETCYRRPITLARVAFPWHRLFEVAVEFTVAPPTRR